MNGDTIQALEAQKRRAIATVMETVDGCRLDDEDRRLVRKAVLDAVNDLHRHTILIVEAAEEGMSVNELLMDRMAARPPR